MKPYAQAQDHFANLRAKMGKRFHKKIVDHFFRSPHADLGGRSPAKAIHDGEPGKVESIIDRMISGA